MSIRQIVARSSKQYTKRARLPTKALALGATSSCGILLRTTFTFHYFFVADYFTYWNLRCEAGSVVLPLTPSIIARAGQPSHSPINAGVDGGIYSVNILVSSAKHFIAACEYCPGNGSEEKM